MSEETTPQTSEATSKSTGSEPSGLTPAQLKEVSCANRDAIFNACLQIGAALVLGGVLIGLTKSKLSVANIIGWAILALYTCFIGHIYALLYYKSPQVYRMYTIEQQPPGWMYMSVAKENVAIPMTNIHSISEMCAIAGGVGKTMLSRFGAYVFAMFVTYICVELKNDTFANNIDLVLQGVAAFGLVTLGTFYDDPYSKTMQHGHLTGVALMAVGGLSGFWIQRINAKTNIWIPAVLTALFVIFFLLFWFFKQVSSSDPVVVTAASRRSVGYEAAALTAVNLSCSLFFIMYE